MDIHYQTLEKDSIALTDTARLEVKQMRDMRHTNIALFVGACIDFPNVAILTEMQPKGSLDDVLTNDDIKLPWNFRFALLKVSNKFTRYNIIVDSCNLLSSAFKSIRLLVKIRFCEIVFFVFSCWRHLY